MNAIIIVIISAAGGAALTWALWTSGAMPC